MQMDQQSLIYDASAQGDSGRVAFFDSLLPLKSGTWLSGFTTGQTKHHHEGTIRLSRSRDNGANWELLPWRFQSNRNGVPGSLTGAEMVETKPGRLLLFTTWFDRSDPERPLFDPDTGGILRSRQLLAESTDEGDSWTGWREIPTPGLTGGALTGPVVEWTDGTIGFAFESFKEFDDPNPARHAAWLLTSRDGGANFKEPFLVARDPDDKVFYWDQRLCSTRTPGEFAAMFWTHDCALQRDLRVHFLYGDINGGSWTASQPVETTIPGQIAAPIVLDDGRLLAFVVDRTRPGTMRLWQSYDDGQSWPESECLTVHTHDEQAQVQAVDGNIDFAEYWEDMGKWSFGHPAIRHAGPDRVLVSWYAGTPEQMSVHAATIDTSESYTR